MQPTRAGEYTVWQRWVNGNWQVMFQQEGRTRQLTEGAVHSIAPYINGDYVIWHTQSNKTEPLLSVYDITTELVTTIDNPEGGDVRNPRFVLVYDTELANGDVLTQGYNPETGETEPLSSVPAAPLPDIPSPDPVGETRALLPHKNESPDKNLTRSRATSTKVGASANEGDGTLGTSTATSTLDMRRATTTESLSEYDLVVPSRATTAKSSAAE
jgi:hypothetical protein